MTRLFFAKIHLPPKPTLFPYTTLFRSRPTLTITGTSRALATSTRRRTRSEVIARKSTMPTAIDRKSTRLNSSHVEISYAVFCLKKKNDQIKEVTRKVSAEVELVHQHTK